MQHAIDFVLSVILTLVGLVVEAIGVADAFLAHLMTAAGLPYNMQIALLIVLGLMLFIFALRVLGGIFGFLLIILLILLIAHRLLPGMQLPHGLTFPNAPPSGSVQL